MPLIDTHRNPCAREKEVRKRKKIRMIEVIVINKTLNSQSKLFVVSKKGEEQHMSSVFLSFLKYRMRGHLVGFHFYPVLLSGVALFLVAFSSALHTNLSRDEVFDRVEGNTLMCYTSQHSNIFFRRDVNVSISPSKTLPPLPPPLYKSKMVTYFLLLISAFQSSLMSRVYPCTNFPERI